MKKLMFGILMATFLFSSVSASYFSNDVDTLNLVQKDSSWNEVENGARAVVTLSVVKNWKKVVQQRARVTAFGLKPKTKYQLVYYGDETHNDEWNYVTCLGKERKTSTQGYFKGGSFEFNHLDMSQDDIAQKIWLVPSSDVDCNTGKLLVWKPSDILFETKAL